MYILENSLIAIMVFIIINIITTIIVIIVTESCMQYFSVSLILAILD